MPATIRILISAVLLMLCNGGLFAQVDLNAGLAAYYPFNGNANDESGLNHHPVFNNATLAEDRFGIPNNAYYFNGVDNYMRIADAPGLNFNDRMSIAVWVKPMGFYYGPCHGNSVLIKGLDVAPHGRYAIRFDDAQYLNGSNCAIATPDTLHQNYWGGSTGVAGGYTPYVEKDKWVSVVYTYDGATAKLYVDCRLVSSSLSPGLTFTSPYDLFFGKLDASTHPYWFNGAMDEIRLYNRPLSEDEVRLIASDGQVVHTPLQTVVLPTGGDVKIGTSNPSSSYQWYPSGPDQDSITVNDDGLYIVETDLNGCSNRDSFAVVRQTNTAIQFSAPDTVCVNTPVEISNVSNASSYYWNFCVADLLNTSPTGTNLGNPGGLLRGPVFSDFVEANGNFYVFVVNHYNPTGIVRLDFGSSLLNTPTAVDLGNFGNTIRRRPEGIQVFQDNGKWYAFVVAGDRGYGDIPQLVRIDFGTNIQNTSPLVTDLGDIGGMDQPLDLYMFRENNVWHAFTVNKDGSMSRFTFNNGLDNPPAAQNYPLGLNYPTGVNVVNDNGKFYVFVTVALSNTIARLDFGSSLLNNPVVVDLGNPGNTQAVARDIAILRFCGAIVGFVVNGDQGTNAHQLVRLNFNNDIESVPTGTLLGNIGSLSFPHSLSKLFRVNDKVYSFITNVSNNTITRLEFPSCNNSSIPSYNGQTPPAITYNTPGIYNINLTTDDGLPTQSSFCKQVVVVPEPAHTPLQTIVLPAGGSIRIGTSNPSSAYQWYPAGPNADSITVTDEGLYIVETGGYGCSNRDSFMVVRQTNTTIQFTAPDTVCVNTPVQVSDAPNASSYYWSFCVSNINETTPGATNLGNISSALRSPVFMDYVFFNGNYYGFVVNHSPGGLVRLNFGNSLLNTPTAVNLGNFGGVIPGHAEGIQVIYNEGKWYAIIVGGNPALGSAPRVLKVEFGADLLNPSPIATNWFNVGGGLDQPIDLHLFQEGNNWYGFTTNSENNTLTRFNFGNSFDNTPTGLDLGNVGGLLEYPTGVFAIDDNGFWRVFVVNGGNNTRSSGNFSLVRLDFGSSLLNTPIAVSLGNPGNLLQHPRDLTLMKLCGQVVGFAVNGRIGSDNIVKLNFSQDLTSVPQASDLGNTGSLNFPHSISKLFRVDDNLYTFITNVSNNTITRLQFSGCTNASIPSSTQQTPPPVIYNAPGTYNINLTVDDGLPTQSSYCRQVVVVPEPVHTPLQTILIRPGETVRIGTGNPSSAYQWFPSGPNADSITVGNEGLYVVETSGYGCNNRDSFRVVFIGGDFSFEQDVCDPLYVRFKNETPNSTVTGWDFGNGSGASANPNPSVNYAATGSYTVTMHILNTNSGVNESITKEIAVQIQPDSLIITPDTTICKDASLQLNAINALSYCWTPGAGLSATDIADPVATPAAGITYYLNALVTGNNLIRNGDFSSGNTAFTSGYSYAANNSGEGQYFVGPAPGAWNSQFTQACGDHTGSGNMLMANGEPTEDRIMWSQTIDISPNTNYAFSAWIQSLSVDNPARLMFSINGKPMGNTMSAGLPVCNWSQFYTTWNSGDNTTAVIAIVNKNTGAGGNDFALDDIHFAPFTIKTDSIVIAVEEPRITAFTDTTICEDSFAPLRAAGNFAGYQWTPANGLSDAFISNPIASPTANTEYIVTGTTLHGCMDSDTVNISVLPAPVITLTDDTEICHNASIRLQAAGGSTYSWWPANGLSDPNIADPVATPLQHTTYVVEVAGSNNCVRRDSVSISIRPYPVFTASPDTTVCEGTSLQLSASGGDHYQWTPEDHLSDPLVANPFANPPAGTVYTIYIRENVCHYDTAIAVRVNVNPTPVVSASRSNDINCSERTTELTASGAVHYSWTPAQYLNYPNTPNPIAGVDATTLFTVTGINEYGCSSEDTVTVRVTPDGDPLFLMPNAFTPNNDGLNDCFSLKKWGRIDLQEFSVYNRWGEKVFTTKNENDCWDGTYRGVLQPGGIYVYLIRAKTFCGEIFRKGTVNLIR